MTTVELNTDGPVAYREAAPTSDATGSSVVLVHGFPESSLMWEPLMSALADAGRPAFAPDLYALGDSTDFGEATFEHSRERFDAWMDETNPEGKVVVVVHDWGGFIGLSWACDHPDRVEALVLSDTGFFSDGKWHDMAAALRSEQGEAIIAAVDRSVFTGLLNPEGKAVFSDAEIDAYWAPFERGDGARATLEFYRSMDFEKLAQWDGKLGAARRSHADPLGSRRPLLPRRGRPPLRARDPRLEADRARRRRALHLGRAAAALRGRGP